MMISPNKTPIPGVDALKAQAKRLRAAMTGPPISHSQALELVARQYGCRDWNTLSALAKTQSARTGWQVGMPVKGRYLGQTFMGQLLSLTKLAGGTRYRVTIQFDHAVDVVSFDSFSSFRSRVTAIIDPEGRSTEKTSDGMPHLVFEGV